MAQLFCFRREFTYLCALNQSQPSKKLSKIVQIVISAVLTTRPCSRCAIKSNAYKYSSYTYSSVKINELLSFNIRKFKLGLITVKEKDPFVFNGVKIYFVFLVTRISQLNNFVLLKHGWPKLVHNQKMAVGNFCKIEIIFLDHLSMCFQPMRQSDRYQVVDLPDSYTQGMAPRVRLFLGHQIVLA